MRPQTPVTYEQDNCRANTPTDRQEFVPIRIRIRPRRWYRTTTYTDNNRADMPTIYELDNRRTDMPAA